MKKMDIKEREREIIFLKIKREIEIKTQWIIYCG